ncbi:MAG: serine protease [Solirubrobacterales bacterium]
MTNVTTQKNRMLAALAASVALVVLAASPGASDAETTNRIVGGAPIPITSAAWQVAILDGNTLGPGRQLYCGGSLIRPRVVLTAAHCVLAPSPYATHDGSDDVVLAGATDWTDQAQGFEDRIAAFFVNPGYNGLPGSGDAAILILDNPVPSAYATPIKLAGPDEGPLWRAGKRATVSGYGSSSEGGPSSRVLKSATIPILKDSYCNSVYPGIFSASTLVCAGFTGGGTDACQGDSGGPLTVHARGGDGGFVRQVGIVSFGAGCARANAPGAYARVGANPLRAFVQAAVNGGPDPGDVIGNGGVCAGFKGLRLRLCKCDKKPKKARVRCRRKVKAQARKGRA